MGTSEKKGVSRGRHVMKGNDKQGIQHADRETNELHAAGEAGEDQTFGSGEGTAYTLYLID